MADQRTPRDLSTREKTVRAVYTPPSTLPNPDPVPGRRFRWVATSVLGQPEPTNVSRKFREGWVPVRAEDHPELMLPPNANGNVEIGGLMLCSMPEELAEARNEYYAKQNAQQMESVDNTFMRNNDARMPLFKERSSSVSRGGGFGSGTK